MTIPDYPPMLLSERPFDLEQRGWLYEIKFDGYRLIADVGSTVTLRMKNGADATKWFPETASALSDLEGARYVLDGEICAMDDLGRVRFEVLHKRAKRRQWYEGAPKVIYAPFDLLVHKGVDITQRPLRERKQMLIDLFGEGAPGILVVTGFEGGGDGSRLLKGPVPQLMLEGMVAKRLDSVYRPGVCSPDWVKVKRKAGISPGRFAR